MFAFVTLGLLLGPMAASLSGAAMADQNISAVPGMDGMMDMAAMPGDMDCCPEKQVKVPDCSKDCPLNVFCVTGISSISTANTDRLSVFGQRELYRLRVFEALASRIGDPPHRPPNI